MRGFVMGLLDELLEELCPEGVEYRTVGETIGVNRGKRLTKKQLLSSAPYVVYHGSKDTPLGNYTNYNVSGNTTIVVNTGGIGGVKFCKDAFWCSDGSFWLGHSDLFVDKFVYYWIVQFEEWFATQKREGGVPTIDRETVESIEIPLPPLPIQLEIVRILDKYTELEAELEAELELRKKQYEYYRDRLLRLDEPTGFPTVDKLMAELCPEGVEYRKIGDSKIANIHNGYAFSASFLKDFGDFGVCKITNIQDGKITKEKMQYVNTKPLKAYAINPQSIVLGLSGSIKAGINNTNETFYLNQRVACFEALEDIDNKYLYYVLMVLAPKYENMISSGSIKNLSTKLVEETEIPVPPLPVQHEIVRILDQFSILTSSLTDGLPAEIQLCHQQYEYYRNKLLDFKRKPV